MLTMNDIAPGLRRAIDGIWYSADTETLSYPEDGNDRCFAIEELSFWFKHRNACITTVVSKLPPSVEGHLFDIGGGNGVVSIALSNAGFKVVLVEPGRKGAANGKRRGISEVICASTATAGFRSQSMPAAGLFDVLEHIEDERAFLQLIHNLLCRDGMLYLTVPAYAALWSAEDDAAGHFRRYNLRGVYRLLKSAGYEILYSTYIFQFLPVPIFLFRTIPYRLGAVKHNSDLTAEKSAHAMSQKPGFTILNTLLSRELARIRNRETIGFGGSCLVAARKI